MSTGLIRKQSDLTEWQSRIASAWQKSVASVIEVGTLIRQAKKELGISYHLLEAELPFSSTVAAFLVKIAENPVLSNPSYHARLPNSYNTLYHLTSVDPKTLAKQIEAGEITPNYSLSSAKNLRSRSPKPSAKSVTAPKSRKVITYDVGTLSVIAPTNVEQFQKDLSDLCAKYNGYVTHTHKEHSLAEWHRQLIHKQALVKIAKCEAEFKDISLADIRMLEDAAHFMTKDRNQKTKAEVIVKGEVVSRTCLPEDYKDFKRITKLLGRKEITRGFLKHWCIENKVPNQFTELTSMDKELYIWEQVRLITERKDSKGGLKRLGDLASRSTIPKIKALAQTALAEVTRFENKV